MNAEKHLNTNTMKTKLNYLFTAHFGRIILGIIIAVIGGTLSENGIIGSLFAPPKYDFFLWVMIAGFSLVGFEAVLLFVYGLIINPIKKLKKKKKNDPNNN
jgi:hypothetical protein